MQLNINHSVQNNHKVESTPLQTVETQTENSNLNKGKLDLLQGYYIIASAWSVWQPVPNLPYGCAW